MKKYLGNYLGIVIMNTDPEKRGRCKIWVPHVSVTVYENWNKDKLDKNFIFPDKTNAEDLDKIIPELKRILPWAECAIPLFGGNASARYFALDRKGTSSDSNYWKDDFYIEGKRPSEIFKDSYPDAFSEVNNVGNRFVNPHSHQYKPSAYSNLARGLFTIPNVGAHVWLFFQDGDPKYPVYFASAAGEEDWKRIYTLNQNTGEELEDFASPDYPQSFENVNVEDGGFLNTDTKTFRSKTVFNSNKHTIELIDTDLREIMKFTHYSGSFLEFNNYTTSQLAVGNDQKLVIGDQFLTVKKNQSIFVQDHVDQIIGGDHFRTIGRFDKNVVKQIYDILKDIHDRKRLFEIKRTAAVADDNGTCGKTYENKTGVSPLQTKAGGPAPCPTCCAGKIYRIVFNIKDNLVPLLCSPNIIVPGVHLIEDKTGACGTKWVLPCKTCCGTGLSPSTQDGGWAADGLKQGLAGYIASKQLELFPLQRLLGNGGNEIVTIHGNKTETIGQIFNDFIGWRKDPVGKIRVAGVAVDPEGTYEYMKPAPIVESVDVDHLPGGDYHVTASNQYRLLVGGGGVQIKTMGNIDVYGGIISIAGEQVNVSSKGEVLIDGKQRTALYGENISLNPTDYGQAVVNGSLGVTRQLLVNGATYHEGEVYLHHITAPLEYQTTECADSLKCATLEPCLPPLEPEGVEILGAIVPTIAWALKLVEWLVLHTHKMPPTQHFHYFKNIPLDLYDTSVGVREDAVAAHVNENVQMPAKPVRTPIPNTCIVPCVCPGVTTTSTTTEEPTTTTTTTTTTEEPTTTTTTEDPND
jgi:hypothetical protein